MELTLAILKQMAPTILVFTVPMVIYAAIEEWLAKRQR